MGHERHLGPDKATAAGAENLPPKLFASLDPPGSFLVGTGAPKWHVIIEPEKKI